MRSIDAAHRLAIVALFAASATGCSPEVQRYIRFPAWDNPGPAYAQRAEAIQHDPYPLNDVGPEIVGGRPLAYQQSLNEVERARLGPARPGLAVYQPAQAPALTAAPPPMIGAPYTAPPVVAGVPYPATPAPIVTTPYPATPAPVAAAPYPAAPVPQSAAAPTQRRAPY